MENQLSFFDQPLDTYPPNKETQQPVMNDTDESIPIEPPALPLYYLGQMVIVPTPSKNIDLEDYYYLENFANDVGKVIRVQVSSKAIGYEVDFGDNKIGIFYEKELKKLLKKQDNSVQ